MKNHFADQAVICFLDIKTSCLRNFTQETKVSAIHYSCNLKFKCPLEYQHYQRVLNVLRHNGISRWVALSCSKFFTDKCLSTENNDVPTNLRTQEQLSEGHSDEVRLSVYFYCTITHIKAGMWILNSSYDADWTALGPKPFLCCRSFLKSNKNLFLKLTVFQLQKMKKRKNANRKKGRSPSRTT